MTIFTKKESRGLRLSGWRPPCVSIVPFLFPKKKETKKKPPQSKLPAEPMAPTTWNLVDEGGKFKPATAAPSPSEKASWPTPQERPVLSVQAKAVAKKDGRLASLEEILADTAAKKNDGAKQSPLAKKDDQSVLVHSRHMVDGGGTAEILEAITKTKDWASGEKRASVLKKVFVLGVNINVAATVTETKNNNKRQTILKEVFAIAATAAKGGGTNCADIVAQCGDAAGMKTAATVAQVCDTKE